MPATDQLVDAVERTMFVYPEVPGLVTDLRVSGVVGRESPVSHPVANLVGCDDLDNADADATIAAISDRFAAHARSFGFSKRPPPRGYFLPYGIDDAGSL